MIAPLTPKQADIDKKLAELGIKSLNRNTADGTHSLYEDSTGHALTLPASIEGYSHFTYAQIIAYLTKVYPESIKHIKQTYGVTKGAALLELKPNAKR